MKLNSAPAIPRLIGNCVDKTKSATMSVNTSQSTYFIGVDDDYMRLHMAHGQHSNNNG